MKPKEFSLSDVNIILSMPEKERNELRKSIKNLAIEYKIINKE